MVNGAWENLQNCSAGMEKFFDGEKEGKCFLVLSPRAEENNCIVQGFLVINSLF